MSNFQSAFDVVKRLSDTFEQQVAFFTSTQYSEAAVRQDFIDKFINALGWDVYHNIEQNPYLYEIRIENPQKQQLSRAQKRADYAFFLRPDFKNPIFFVEAKKPSKNLKNQDDYFQTIRYGWNAGTGVSVLTDFEEFHVIDCRLEPDINHVFNGQHKVYHFSDFRKEEKFKEIYWLFSYEAIIAGNLERYVDSLPKPRGGAYQTTLFGGKYQDIDESFLEYIDNVREKLAKAFKKNDADLDSSMLTEAVQRTIDRLVFIRFLEDKLIEPNNYVSEFGSRTTSWRDFITASRQLDVKYNGVVFKKHFIDLLQLSDEGERIFWNICHEFSHLNSKYDFNYIPIHILGSIYERFLGKVVIATEKKVKIEEKPEVRKAGGVYYTPKYIVDYIVKRTVGEVIKGKAPKDIAKLKFADIACGSGSFLISVLECLFDHYNKYYNENPDEAKKDKCLKKDGFFALTIKQKQAILLNNIYGVDLDHQAIEVTQLSLYLKMLEDETTATANEMQVLFHEKILPDLSKNILHGNSIIAPDISYGRLFELEEEKKINPLDFYSAFPAIKKNRGFDAIVGNPPYGADLSPIEREYLLKKFPFGNSDTAALFMLNAHSLLKKGGKVGYIIPKAFTYASNWKKTRDHLLADLNEIVDCSKVWKEVKLEMSIYISERGSNSELFESLTRTGETFNWVGNIPKSLCKTFDFIINGVGKEEIEIALKMKKSKKVLNDYISNQRGGMFQNLVSETGDYEVWGGKQIGRYYIGKQSKGRVSSKKIKDPKSFVAKDSILAQNIVAHVMNPSPHVVIIATIPASCNNVVILDTINQLKNISKVNSKFILGVLNSKLLSWYTYKFIYANAIRTMHFDSTTTEKVPFPNIDLSKKPNKEIHDAIVVDVEQLLNTKELIPNAVKESDKNFLLKKSSSCEQNININVYKLFGLSEDQIERIESVD